MTCSYVSYYVHIVFGTKDRVHSIREEIQPKLWAYMAGIAKGHGIHAVAIGGFADHAHALIDLGCCHRNWRLRKSLVRPLAR